MSRAEEGAMSEPKPAYYCGVTINGPKYKGRTRLWIKQCRQRVKAPGERCRFHDGLPGGWSAGQ